MNPYKRLLEVLSNSDCGPVHPHVILDFIEAVVVVKVTKKGTLCMFKNSWSDGYLLSMFNEFKATH